MISIARIGAFLIAAGAAFGQATTSEILGTVLDASGAAVPQARIMAKNLGTNDVRETTTGIDGRFRIPQLPPGSYEVQVEKPAFARFQQGPIVLRLGQDADLRIKLEVSGVAETVHVLGDAPLINTTNAEVGVNFDSKRVSELPLAPNRNIVNLALSVAGVSQISAGQSSFASSGNNGTETGIAFSVNGARLRSNNFIIDGQDANEPGVAGISQSLNNPDVIAEFRLVTNQFAPEYGRASGSVVSVITKSGTNSPHGSAFWFHNDNHLNSRSNLDKALAGTPPKPRFESAPFRIENQFGGTFGGPIRPDKTFFFGSLQRWTDRRLGSGNTIRGVPTEEGRQLMQSVAGSQPPIQALLEQLPAAQAPVAGLSANLTSGGRTVSIPLGTLSGATSQAFDDWQWSTRVDHRLSDRHNLGGRYMYDDFVLTGDGQVTPPGLTTANVGRRQALSAFGNSSLSPRVFNELRVSYLRYKSETVPDNPASMRIPSVEINELGLTGFNADPTRSAIGLAVNQPQFRFNNLYQIQETLGVLRGSHSMKFGVDFRRTQVKSFFVPSTRGRLAYTTLQNYVDDTALTGQINARLPGGETVLYYNWYDYYFFLQDEWRATPNFTLTYGVRYETPGEALRSLIPVNDRVVSAAGGNDGYRLRPLPSRDTNNWAPRVGFNYRFGTAPGILGRITGEGKLVLRGGYSRTYDYAFLNMALNVASAFPFINSISVPSTAIPAAGAFTNIQRIAQTGYPADPRTATRTIIGGDFRAPYAEQVAMQFQRELARDWALTVGYVGTKGTALYQTVDGNPAVPGSNGTQRLNPDLGVVRLRCNCTSSIYHSLQTSLEKRLSRNFSMAAHYTWSSFIDGASEVFNPSVSGEVAVSQDSFNRDADRGRSTYDRPQRLTINGVWELPLMREQRGVAGRILGGWQVSGFLTFQSGAPFTALNGADPGFRLSGIDSLVGNSIRANANTNLDVAGMSVEEMFNRGGRSLFAPVTAAAPLGNLGRNVLRADGITNLDLGFFKNTKIAENHSLQYRAEFYRAANTRDFGIPESRINSAAFLNQWGRNGGNRRISMGLRYYF